MEKSRREFLKTAAAGLSLAAAPAIGGSVLGANDRIRVAVIGLRGRGRELINSFHQLAGENVEIVALCDVDQAVLEERTVAYEKLAGKKVQTLGDMRKVLDDRSIDAVGYATPNHWHA